MLPNTPKYHPWVYVVNSPKLYFHESPVRLAEQLTPPHPPYCNVDGSHPFGYTYTYTTLTYQPRSFLDNLIGIVWGFGDLVFTKDNQLILTTNFHNAMNYGVKL